MIDYNNLELFNQSSIRKDIDMVYDSDKHITNDDVVTGTFSLNESACSTKELKFGSLVASKLSAKLFNRTDNLNGKELSVSITINKDTANPLNIGKYKVISDKPTSDRSYKQIEAYDGLYEVIHKDVSDWYESLAFPLTQKAFRDSFFNYIGIEQIAVSLVNDNMIIEKTISTNSLSGRQVLSAICELNGAIGRMNREGKFAYIILNPNPTNRITINKIQSGSGSYEDYECKPISKVQIRQEANDIGAIVGVDGNTYIVQDNFLVYGKSSTDLTNIATNLLSVIRGITYRPFKVKSIYGNPCYEIGDALTVVTKNATFNTYMLNRTLNGINAMSDTIKAEGVEVYTENLNSTNTQFQQLKRQTNVLERTVEKTVSQITAIDKKFDDYSTTQEMQSAIEQSAEGISTQVVKKITTAVNLASYDIFDELFISVNVKLNYVFEIWYGKILDGGVYHNYQGLLPIKSSKFSNGKTYTVSYKIQKIDGVISKINTNTGIHPDAYSLLSASFDGMRLSNPYDIWSVDVEDNQDVHYITLSFVYNKIDIPEGAYPDDIWISATCPTGEGVKTKIFEVMVQEGSEATTWILPDGNTVLLQELISSINQTAESITINADKINLNGAISANGKVKVTTDGRLIAEDGEFNGTIKSNNAEITGGSLKIKTSSKEEDIMSLSWTSSGGYEWNSTVRTTGISATMKDPNTGLYESGQITCGGVNGYAQTSDVDDICYSFGYDGLNYYKETNNNGQQDRTYYFSANSEGFVANSVKTTSGADLDSLNSKLSQKQDIIKVGLTSGTTDSSGNLELFYNRENMVLSCAVIDGYKNAFAIPSYYQPANKWYAKIVDPSSLANITSQNVTVYYVYI